MSVRHLKRRIKGQHRNAQAARQQLGPIGPMRGSTAPDPNQVGGVPMMMPLSVITYRPTAAGRSATVDYQDAQPLWAAGPFPGGIPAAGLSSGSAGRVVAAGNPREGAATQTGARASHALRGM